LIKVTLFKAERKIILLHVSGYTPMKGGWGVDGAIRVVGGETTL
jgi:hypothetical protein